MTYTHQGCWDGATWFLRLPSGDLQGTAHGSKLGWACHVGPVVSTGQANLPWSFPHPPSTWMLELGTCSLPSQPISMSYLERRLKPIALSPSLLKPCMAPRCLDMYRSSPWHSGQHDLVAWCWLGGICTLQPPYPHHCIPASDQPGGKAGLPVSRPNESR